MWDDLELLDADRERWDAPAERVLVAVVPCPADWARLRAEGWYRIPYARAPQRLAADYLAFYHPGCFAAPLRWTVSYYAAVRRYDLLTRAELLPDEAGHPRAEELYYRLAVGPLQALPAPIPSARLRRVTFIATTLPLLLAAREINDLWPRETRPQRLQRAYALRERASAALYAARGASTAVPVAAPQAMT
jgi:hypothetical protein